MTVLTDGELIARVRRREAAALEALYDRYAGRMLGLAVRIVNRTDAAEDILQEAFFRVWERADSFDPARGSFVAWLATIVRNRCLDHLRKHGVVVSAAVALDDDEDPRQRVTVADPAPDALSTIITRDQRTHLRQALAELPEEQRQVIELSFFGGLTRREIAVRLGCPPGTVHTRARLALEKLRGALQQEEGSDR